MKPNLKSLKNVAYFLRWLPMVGPVILMAAISLGSVASFSQFKTSNFLREHSYEVLATTQTFLSDLSSIRGDDGITYSPDRPLTWNVSRERRYSGAYPA